jgi:hypothetical protein
VDAIRRPCSQEADKEETQKQLTDSGFPIGIAKHIKFSFIPNLVGP